MESGNLELSFISWNVNKGLRQKLKDPEFVNIVNNYDIICLLECWVSENDQIELEGYEQHIFPRSKGRGGGIAIFYKSNLSHRVSIVENILNTIVWIKITGSDLSKPIFIAVCYLPPESSVFL